jgi:hypothetical protein
MNETELPILKHALIKVVGVFAYDPKRDKHRFTNEEKFESMKVVILADPFREEETLVKIVEKTKAHLKNTYYKEFRGLIFDGNADDEIPEGVKRKAARSFLRRKELKSFFALETRNGEILQFGFTSDFQELYLFPDGTGIFSISILPDDFTLKGASNLINKARDFSSKVSSISNPEKRVAFHAWISEHILGGIPLVGDKINADEYSGSKFKVFAVYDVDESSVAENYNRKEVLFELGTNARLGTIRNQDYFAPSEQYYNQIMDENCFSAFRNYDMLALMDSFTVLGTGNYQTLESGNYMRFNNWSKVYFALYIYNLYLRYSLFRFNANYLKDPVKYRGQFEEFLNYYNLKHISFNFLPNIIFEKMRHALGVEDEIEQFEKRLKNLAQSIQEQQEKRQAFLLTIISVLSSLDAIDLIIGKLHDIQIQTGLSPAVFILVLVVALLVAANFLVRFLFPIMYEKYRKRITKAIYASKRKKKTGTS